jgi:hypothetical protein
VGTELDHVFICTAVGAPEADELRAIGLIEGTSNVHPGQGTANRRFFFHNFYLELLWVHDEEEAKGEPVRPTHLWERWSKRMDGVCGLGFGFRPAVEGSVAPPFGTWQYRPPYLPEPLSIEIGTNSENLNEPMLFYLSFAGRPESYMPERRQPMQQQVGLSELTRVELTTPHANVVSRELRAVVAAGLVELQREDEYLVTLAFDHERSGKRVDLRPSLPLLLTW